MRHDAASFDVHSDATREAVFTLVTASTFLDDVKEGMVWTIF